MADYYTNGIGRRKKRTRSTRSGKSIAMFLLDAVVTVVMSLLILCTFVVIICQYISPEKSGILSVIAIGAPIIYLLDIVVMFYWIVRWRWYRAVMMIVTVVAGLFYLSRYYKIDISRHYETSYVERRYHKVMTYNVRDGRGAEIPSYIAAHNPDILCLQEISVASDSWQTISENYATTESVGTTSGCQILTKHRIVRSGEIPNLLRLNGVWADLKIKNDTVRVVNLHLKSTSIRPEDTQFLEKHEYILDKDREDKFRSIISRLADNNCKRAVQADAVAEFLEGTPYTVIVCGDFNDVPLSYTYNKIVKNLADTFSKCAQGFEYTYDTRYGLLRIDNIFVSPSVEVVSYEVDDEVKLSDHFPVISRIKFEIKR